MNEQAEKVAEFVELGARADRLPEACARTLLHYEHGRSVALYVPDPDEAAELDALLWTFRQNAFIPHVRLEEGNPPLIEPVVIFSGEAVDLEADVLIVLTPDELPPGFGRFDRLCDFAEVYDKARRQASRERFAACKAAGYRMRFIRR